MIPRLLHPFGLALFVSRLSFYTTAWLLPRSGRIIATGPYQNPTFLASARDPQSNIVDVDFERVDSYQEGSDVDGSRTDTADPLQQDKKKNLFDLSLEADPRWQTTRIPFCRGDEYIDAKLAFTVELEGIQYGIAVPFDDAVAIIVQEKKKEKNQNGETKPTIHVTYVDPDKYDENDEYQELMEIMAAQVHQELGEDLMLRKTPKVLTISGGLSRITNNWEQELLGQPAPVEDFLKSVQLGEESTDEDVSDFMAFMRQELGDEEFEKTMREDPSDDEKELMKFFEVPGLGDKKDDIAGLEELIKSMEDDLNEETGVRAKAQMFELDTERLGLKLISFEFGDGKKSYSLVKLLEPYVLVGKYSENEYEPTNSGEMNQDFHLKDIRFELLSAEEERLLIPMLENICQKDLAKAGLSFSKEEHTESS